MERSVRGSYYEPNKFREYGKEIRERKREDAFKFYNKMASSVFDLDNIADALENGKTDAALRLLRKRADIMRELCSDFRSKYFNS